MTFVGITGLERRPDGRGVALRFALWPEAQGRGLAREAAGAALRFGHDAGRAAAHRRGRAREQLRVAHGAGRHRHDRMRQLRAAAAGTMVMYQSVRLIPPAPPAAASR